jgi:hypothetical protein
LLHWRLSKKGTNAVRRLNFITLDVCIYGPRCYNQQLMKVLFHSKLQDDLTEDDFRGKKEVFEMYDDDN